MVDVGALHAEYFGRVVGYFVRRLGDRRLAEDLAQEVFLRAHRAAGSYEERGRPASAWLFTIAANLLVDQRRERGRVSTVSLELVGERAATRDDVGDDRQVTRLDVVAMLDRLTPEQRAVVEARFLRDQSIRQTAALVGCSEEGVKKRLARALARLRRMHPTRAQGEDKAA